MDERPRETVHPVNPDASGDSFGAAEGRTSALPAMEDAEPIALSYVRASRRKTEEILKAWVDLSIGIFALVCAAGIFVIAIALAVQNDRPYFVASVLVMVAMAQSWLGQAIVRSGMIKLRESRVVER